MTPQERYNAACNITGEAVWGFQAAMVLPGTVLTVLLTELGATRMTIGIIPSLDGLGMLLPIVGIYVFRSRKKRKTQIVMFHYLFFTPLLALMGLSVLIHELYPGCHAKSPADRQLGTLHMWRRYGHSGLARLDFPSVSEGDPWHRHRHRLGIFKSRGNCRRSHRRLGIAR